MVKKMSKNKSLEELGEIAVKCINLINAETNTNAERMFIGDQIHAAYLTKMAYARLNKSQDKVMDRLMGKGMAMMQGKTYVATPEDIDPENEVSTCP